MLQPVVRRTWAPRGQTPILRQWDRRDRLSTISAITVARFTLIWDRGQPHRAKLVKDRIARRRRIVVEWLPPYAPDLNPVEAVWSHTKYGDLANHAPDCIQDLEQSFLSSMVRTRDQSHLLSAFFKAAGLNVR